MPVRGDRRSLSQRSDDIARAADMFQAKTDAIRLNALSGGGGGGVLASPSFARGYGQGLTMYGKDSRAALAHGLGIYGAEEGARNNTLFNERMPANQAFNAQLGLEDKKIGMDLKKAQLGYDASKYTVDKDYDIKRLMDAGETSRADLNALSSERRSLIDAQSRRDAAGMQFDSENRQNDWMLGQFQQNPDRFWEMQGIAPKKLLPQSPASSPSIISNYYDEESYNNTPLTEEQISASRFSRLSPEDRATDIYNNTLMHPDSILSRTIAAPRDTLDYIVGRPVRATARGANWLKNQLTMPRPWLGTTAVTGTRN